MAFRSAFIVLDTEGRDLLREVAVLDARGQVCYQAWVEEHPENNHRRRQARSLSSVMQDLRDILPGQPIVCHNAAHDRQVLLRAFQRSGISAPALKFICTLELAQTNHPDAASYGLEYLSKWLGLRVNQKLFNPRQAHSARYDAEFTYQLYQVLSSSMQASPLRSMSQVNPFASSRVDTPFQDHPDQKQVYQREFEQLKVAIQEIHHDRNHQSRGAVVIGEPGSGKTHLMMRLAQELLTVNRLLFIRQPNNEKAVIHHIYSRILESFIEKVGDTGLTQLEHLIAHSFIKLLSTSSHLTLTKYDQVILSIRQDPLKLYKLTKEGAETKRALWKHIDRRLQEWWVEHYGFSGHATQILKGIVKFCSYSEPRRKTIVQRWLAGTSLNQEDLALVELEDWREDLGQEGFALEAIAVFSKLSLLDEPLLIVFDQLESLGLAHNHNLLLNFGEAVKEIFTHVPNSLIILNLFPDRWEQFQSLLSPAVLDRVSQTQVVLRPPTPDLLRSILERRSQDVGAQVSDFFTAEDLQIILAQPSIRAMLNSAANYFQYRVRGVPLPTTVSRLMAPVPEADEIPTAIPPLDPAMIQRMDHLEAQLVTLQQQMQQMQEQIQQALVRYATLPPTDRIPAPPVPIPVPISTVATPLATPLATPTPSPVSELQSYLESQHQFLAREYLKPNIITDSDDLGKLTAIAQAFRLIQPFEIDYLSLGGRKLPEHLVLKGRRAVAVGFLNVEGNSFTSRLKNWNELVVSDRSIYHQLWRDVRSYPIAGKVGREEIEKLDYAENGSFCELDQEQRIDFELIYRLITDVQNRDLDIAIEDAMRSVKRNFSESWIVQLLESV